MKKIISLVILVLILSSCGEAIFDSQVEKARDSTRILDLSVMRAGLEQVYQDEAEYPAEIEGISGYLPSIPVDLKAGEIKNGCTFGYKYEVMQNKDKIDNGAYRLSTCFESSKNIKSKAKNDGGIYDDRFEITGGL